MLSMEENSDGKRKTIPTIPANYVSILQLKERWLKEKEQKRKEEEEEEEEERRRKQQVEEEQKIEKDLKKAEEVRKQLEKDERLDRSNRGRNGWKKELRGGGEAKFAEKEEPKVTAAIGSGGGEDTAEGLPEKNRGFRRKRYTNKKKKIPDVAVVKDVVDCGYGSIAPPENVGTTENITPVKDVSRDYKKKGEKSTGKKSVIYREKEAITDDATTKAVETQIENLSIKSPKSQTRSSHRNCSKPGNDLVHQQRVRMPIGGAAASMVWVKKDKANDGIASGVKPFNA